MHPRYSTGIACIVSPGVLSHLSHGFRFWPFLSSIFETLHNQVCRANHLHCVKHSLINSQNLEDQYPHLISDLGSVCVQAFQKTEPDPGLSVLVYYEHYSHILHIDALNPASVFPLFIVSYLQLGPHTHQIIKAIIVKHTELQIDALTGHHYPTVAQYFWIVTRSPLSS